MAFCGYCGAQMPDDMSFCTECGKPLTRGKKIIDNTGSDAIENSVRQDEINKSAESEWLSQEKPVDSADDTSYERWTMSEGMDLTEPENLYNSLKITNERKNKAEKKKFILPLVLTLIFAAVAIVLVIIKLKPFENLSNGSDSVSEAEVTDDKAELGTDDVKPSPATTTNTSSNSSSQSSSSSNTQNETAQDPRVVGSGGCIQPLSQFSDYVYMDYYYDVYNPNTTLIVQAPKVTTTMRSTSGSIIATDSVETGLIMPGDTVRMFGVIQVLKSDVDSYDNETYLLEWRKISKESGFYSPIRSDEFVFSNVSARGASYSGTVTGELTNNSSYDIGLSAIYAIFYKNGEIVMISDGFTDGVPSGSTRVFEINTFETIPDYDTIECFIDLW